MKITDEYIEELFDNTDFGAPINESTVKKRELLAKNLRDQVDGYWTGRTLYHLMVRGGFLIDSKSGKPKKLTELGRLFMMDEGGLN